MLNIYWLPLVDENRHLSPIRSLLLRISIKKIKKMREVVIRYQPVLTLIIILRFSSSSCFWLLVFNEGASKTI